MVTVRVRNLNQVIKSPPDSPEAIVVPDSVDVQTPVEGQGGGSCEKQDQDGASATEKGIQSRASNEKQGHVGASMSGKQVQGQEISRYVLQGQEISRYVAQVPEGAQRTTSSPPELFNMNNRVVSEGKIGLGGKEGQSGALSTGPQGRQGGASWTGGQSQVIRDVTGGQEIQGRQEISSARPEIADRSAASSSPRLNANYRDQASNVTRIKKINYPIGTWSLENGQAMGFFNVTRFDDKIVPVDNHFLREKYPELLIDFYEQNIFQKHSQQSETEETISKPPAK